MPKEDETNKSELIKTKQNLKKLLTEIENSKKHHEQCLELLKKGATRGNQTLDNNKTLECIEKEKELINQINKSIKEIDAKIK